VAAALLALALTAALWWSYFDRDDQQAEHAFSSVSGGDRSRMALYAFGYAHLLMLAGVVLTAAGVKLLIEQLHEATSLATSTMLAGGIALYLLGDVVFRRIIHVSSSRLRLSIALLSLLTIPLGIWACAHSGRRAAGARAELGASRSWAAQ
jgi:low temperature requirement protein LtrA